LQTQKVFIYHGFPKWSSKGVQIGNAGSAAGIIGAWIDATHEQGWF
jgi:hypothetical protein